jgi:O-antigen/teichoic acid export membrane protein
VFHLGLAWYGLSRYPELLRGDRQQEPQTGDAQQLDQSVRRSIWSLSWPNLVFNLCSRVGLLTDNIVVAAILGPAAVASFYLTQRIIVLVLAQVQAIGGATWAGLLDLHYRGQREVFLCRLAQLTRVTAVFATAALLPTAVWNRALITLWLGPDQYAGEVVTWLAAANAWVLAVSSVWGYPLSAGGHVRTVLPIVITSTTVNLVVSLAATTLLGISGPLVGTCAGLTLVSWWWALRALRRHFDVSPWPLLASAVSPALLGVPYGLGLLFISQVVPVSNPAWPRWVGLVAILGVLATAALGYLVLAWFLVFPRETRQEWAERLRGWVLVRPGDSVA